MQLLIADDHTLFRDSLVQYIQRACPDVQVLLASDFHEAFAMANDNEAIDLVMLDYRMPGMMGLDGLRRMRESYPDIPVALMSGVAEDDQVRQAIGLGARAYFPKTMSGKALVEAIQLVLDGEQYIPRDAKTNNILPSHYDDASGDLKGQPIVKNHEDLGKLTPREMQVLKYLSKGASNKEIARDLDLQIVTIKLHVRGICKKLGAKNRTQAAISAREMGVIS